MGCAGSLCGAESMDVRSGSLDLTAGTRGFLMAAGEESDICQNSFFCSICIFIHISANKCMFLFTFVNVFVAKKKIDLEISLVM